VIDPGFWHGRRVLVTGHSGFKGAWLTLWLAELGAEITGFAGPPPSEPSLFALAAVSELVQDLRGDIRDAASVRDALARAQPEVVLHLAAQPLVRRSLQQPVETWEANVAGTLNVLEAVRAEVPQAAVVVVTSDKCYRNDGSGRRFAEGDPVGGRDPYSASKAAQELVAASHRASYGLRIATARAGNVIGGGDWGADRLVPDFVRAAAAGEEIVVRNPGAVRPWQHVLNPLEGYLLLAERLHASGEWAQAWNFGPPAEDEWEVRAVLDRLATAWPGAPAVRVVPSSTAEAAVLRLDSTLARERLGWAPATGLVDGLRATVQWYLGVRDGADARALTLEQIAAHQAR
jgi:CDP-glucose 4,6-dehydratase